MYTYTVLATEMRYYIADAIGQDEVVRRHLFAPMGLSQVSLC